MSDNTPIEALEFKCAFLERAVQELSDVIHRQQQELDRHRARIDALAGQLKALEGAGDAPAAGMDARAEIPPHY